MQIARAFPVNSKQDVIDFARRIDKEWSTAQRAQFFQYLGGAKERWYFQEIDGKPHVVSVIEGPDLEKSFSDFAASKDPFTVWFRDEVRTITGIDLTRLPKGPPTELLYELRAK